MWALGGAGGMGRLELAERCSWRRRGSRDVLPRVKLDADSSTEGARVTQLPLCRSASGAVVPTCVPRTAGIFAAASMPFWREDPLSPKPMKELCCE